MLGNRTYISYDPLDRVTSTTNARGGVTQQTYDNNGNVTSQTDENNHLTSFTYDGQNRIIGMTDALLHNATVGYEPGGASNHSVDNKGQITNRIYDALGRLTTVNYGSNVAGTTSLSSTTYTWDAGNRITQIVDSVSGTTTLTYNTLNQLTTETNPQGTITRTFDAAGRRATMTVAGQPTITYTYDNANRLTQIQQAAGTTNGNVVQTIAYTYDNANRVTKLVYANGINAVYAYDNGNQLTGISYTKADGSAIGTLTYTYDTVGRRTGVGGTLAQTNAGTALSTTAFNVNNQETTFGTQTLTYDANGNLTGDGTHTYTWDERNQLRSISGGTTGSFQYDAFGRRIGKTIGTTSTGYLYDGMNFIQEKSGTGGTATVNANLISGPSADALLSRQTSASNQSMLIDGLGSVILATDATQSTVTTYTYDAYGNTVQTGTNDNSQQYTARENDQNGLYYYRARYYSPGMGRFISQDSVGWASGQTNGYSYVGDNPINYRDPSGHVAVLGFTIGALGNLGYQLLNNGGHLSCVNWLEVGGWGLAGATLGGFAVEGIEAVSWFRAALAEAGESETAEAVGETFFRTMSSEHYDELLVTGRLPSTAETFISPTQSFAESYNGILVEFNMKPGALNALESIGVRDGSALTKATYGDMPLVSKGWSSSNAYFKAEGTQINIGLGRGTALDTFNSFIQGFSGIK